MEQLKRTPIHYSSEQEIKDRHIGVETIAEKIQCIKEIYQDLSELVETQGESIDMIESQCETTKTTTHAGLEQLEVASRNQRRCLIM